MEDDSVDEGAEEAPFRDANAPLDQSAADADGVVRAERVGPLRKIQPAVPIKDGKVKEWARAFPGMFDGEGRWDLQAMQPWKLIFVD